MIRMRRIMTETPSAKARMTEIMTMAQQLVARAQELNVDVTIELRPLKPLAMGHHVPVVDVRMARRAINMVAPIYGKKER
jgi:hypothetical protein